MKSKGLTPEQLAQNLGLQPPVLVIDGTRQEPGVVNGKVEAPVKPPQPDRLKKALEFLAQMAQGR
jgi:hypothetical protein